MIVKLLIAALFALAAVSEASWFITSYSDSTCTTPSGFYAHNERCLAFDSDTCTPFPYNGEVVYFRATECTNITGDPTTPIPTGYQYYTTSTKSPCDFSIYEIFGTASPNPTVIFAFYSESIATLPMNLTITCNNGNMTVDNCVPTVSCNGFASIPNNVCTNVTTSTTNQFYNAIQTTCTPPVPMAPIAAPVAATPKVATPTAATPAKRSESVTLAVGSFVALFATAATLIW